MLHDLDPGRMCQRPQRPRIGHPHVGPLIPLLRHAPILTSPHPTHTPTSHPTPARKLRDNAGTSRAHGFRPAFKASPVRRENRADQPTRRNARLGRVRPRHRVSPSIRDARPGREWAAAGRGSF
ncbi:hypothetical protein L3i22_002170 [Actinoplanes sp. L3-i22]|nr:hypothetical protein L3i22_002170 [Actinoplanes sp. L3-i22]